MENKIRFMKHNNQSNISLTSQAKYPAHKVKRKCFIREKAARKWKIKNPFFSIKKADNLYKNKSKNREYWRQYKMLSRDTKEINLTMEKALITEEELEQEATGQAVKDRPKGIVPARRQPMEPM